MAENREMPPSKGGAENPLEGVRARLRRENMEDLRVRREDDEEVEERRPGRRGGGGSKSGGLGRFVPDLSGITEKLPEGWYYYIVGAGLFLAGYYYFSTYGFPDFGRLGGKALIFPGMPGLVLRITLAVVALLVGAVLGLVEAQNREDPALLDWWVPYVVVGVLVYGQLFGHDNVWWGVAIGVAAASLIFATLWNPESQEEPNWLDRIDTTAIFQTAFILALLYFGKWRNLPYPEFIPPVVVFVVGALAIFKELMRTPKFALLVVGMGIAAAVLFNPLAIFGTLAASIFMAAKGARQGWIPGTSSRSEISAQIMGRKFKLILAWDVVLCWFAVFVLTAIYLYRNPVVAVIGGR